MSGYDDGIKRIGLLGGHSRHSTLAAAAALALAGSMILEPPSIRNRVLVRDQTNTAPRRPEPEPDSRQRKRWLQRQARKQQRTHRK